MRFAIDTGGTFTDAMVEDDDGALHMFKSPTVPDDPVHGVMDVLGVAANIFDMDLESFLKDGSQLIYGSTTALNAIVTGNTAKTAFLTTEGHPDILTFREGGREKYFAMELEYPQPYVPRSLTFQVPERIGYDGEVVKALDEAAVVEICKRLRDEKVEAVGICLIWSIVNPTHELRVAQIINEQLPDVYVTMSHSLNPSIREYRRAISTVIDASLKPLMTTTLSSLERRLREAGFKGRALMLTMNGGVVDAEEIARKPILSVGSGPTGAPIAGAHIIGTDQDVASAAIIADTGGTTYDMSLVREGVIPRTREKWLGDRYLSDITGIPAVEVMSIGAGGGSIAWVDDGGLLRVGPQSAGADPGPACYNKGGDQPTLSDACLALGILDPEFFLGGKFPLDKELSRKAIDEQVASRLGMSVDEAAASILRISTEDMAGAIENIANDHGVDPRKAALVAGGGAAGLNAAAVGRRLNMANIILPDTCPALSAAGAMISDLTSDFALACFVSSSNFDIERVNDVLADLESQCQAFIDGPGADAIESSIEFYIEARYAGQVWEIEIPVKAKRFASQADVDVLVQEFHETHDRIYAVHDPDGTVEILAWRGRARCRLRDASLKLREDAIESQALADRPVYFGGHGWLDSKVIRLGSMQAGKEIAGPAIVESPYTTIVVNPGMTAVRQASGNLHISVA